MHKQLIYLLLILAVYGCNTNEKYSAVTTPTEASTFVGSISCKECHQQEYDSWEGSHHDQAMKFAGEHAILGDFDNAIFTHKNVKSTFFKKDGDYYVNTEGSDGTYRDYKIIYTFGVTPLQQYIVKLENGKFHCLITAWDSVENKWYHLQPDLDIANEEWMHWTGGSMNWNNMCADCHSTNVHKNYESETDTYTTSFSEINVSCEACHGPSSSHVEFYEKELTGTPPKMHMGTGLSSEDLVQQCARCHSRRSQFTDYYNYEGHFLDHYNPQLLTDPTYFVDGQIRDEDYVYASFMQSKMYSEGISCRDCHDVHSMELKIQGNNLCLTCHVPSYNTPEHHYHEVNTEASQCINCHMTGRIYMGNDFRRDHSFRNPRPDQTEKYGTPNACNSCHTDKSAKWAADFIREKYGEERADHFSDHLLEGFHNNKEGYETLFSNTNYPEIARATAINQYMTHQVTREDVNKLLKYLKDSSALVRNETVKALETTRSPEFSSNIAPLLNDSIRLVRISAARYFNLLGIDRLEDVAYKNATKEYLKDLNYNLDFASGNHQKAIYYQSKNNTEDAIKHYERAIEIDNYFNMSRMNLALIYYQIGRVKESEALYLKVVEQEPEFSSSYYMLGLLYNETGDTDKSMEYLELAAKKEPRNSSVFYNYALMLQKAGDNKKSLEIINSGLEFFPNTERLLYVKLLGELNLEQNSKAKATCLELLKIAPDNTDYANILKSLEQ
ncbi:tetratricopeptide repeat protein [Lutibacter sp. A80]|uniref:multiheme c-type cytochrome n=1 Tax=Lutibacter sp. A80 TaxID=2918453 RepID=UPI001F064D01|nr:multiheme c-type cytochrome [Lutibacter sp. A80]UMB60303.1 tetratricopeptide repeat protein [Lutibacter sp. A80]